MKSISTSMPPVKLGKANKRSIGNGSYKYVCCKKGKNNKTCNAKCLPGEDYCKVHLKMFQEDRF